MLSLSLLYDEAINCLALSTFPSLYFIFLYLFLATSYPSPFSLSLLPISLFPAFSLFPFPSFSHSLVQ